MAPSKAPSLSTLFHPKKKKAQQKQYSGVNGLPKNLPKPGSPQKSQSRTSTPTPSIKVDDDDDTFKLPTTPYSEFRILSSAMQGWKYDVMKFDSRKTVDLNTWQRPIKLNRKDLRRDDPANATAAQPQAVGPMLGPDGKPVIGVDGKVVMVDAEGKPIHAGETGYGAASGSGSKDKGKGNAAGGRKRFQKKTRQVFLVPDEVRQLRKEERYPWVMEDSTQSEMWVGHLEEVSKAETHALFMPAVNDSFKFIPPHRWYKFQKKIKHDFPTDTANVEQLYTQSQKKDPSAFLAALNGGKGASSETAKMFKGEAEGKVPDSVGQSLGPGGRKLKKVDSGANQLFGDEDDGDSGGRRRRKDLDQDGDMDEQLYEEEFADDEEQMHVDENDEEAKEIEERLKREYQRANKQNEVGIDEDEEDDDDPKTRQAKALEKMMRDREGNKAYESDDDEKKNPYASSEEEEEEEPEPIHTGPAIQQQPQQVDPNKPSTPKPPASAPQTSPNSRANSPVSPSLGGHSLMAKRATSPKMPKSKMPGSRPASPAGSRANSPTPVSASRATSPLATSSAASGEFKNNKRKADDSPTSPINGAGASDVPKPKKKKIQNVAGNVSVSASELEALLVEWLKNTPNATTRNCVQHFNSYMLGGPDRRNEFSSLVKRVAILKEGVLTLKPGLG